MHKQRKRDEKRWYNKGRMAEKRKQMERQLQMMNARLMSNQGNAGVANMAAMPGMGGMAGLPMMFSQEDK